MVLWVVPSILSSSYPCAQWPSSSVYYPDRGDRIIIGYDEICKTSLTFKSKVHVWQFLWAGGGGAGRGKLQGGGG